ncbi:MAG: hypothetical protein DMG40_13470 [Acidobacteria bacterium]|nr:MAG: hypothetical protein DMG40_13470 [Acidobacteriota bacterium]
MMISETGPAQLREAMDLTQESLAETLHVTQASISKNGAAWSGRLTASAARTTLESRGYSWA